jgi:hypothetical protein
VQRARAEGVCRGRVQRARAEGACRGRVQRARGCAREWEADARDLERLLEGGVAEGNFLVDAADDGRRHGEATLVEPLRDEAHLRWGEG